MVTNKENNKKVTDWKKRKGVNIDLLYDSLNLSTTIRIRLIQKVYLADMTLWQQRYRM